MDLYIATVFYYIYFWYRQRVRDCFLRTAPYSTFFSPIAFLNGYRYKSPPNYVLGFKNILYKDDLYAPKANDEG